MITLLTILVLAQPWSAPAPRPRVFRVDGAGRTSRAGDLSDSTYRPRFEFAPSTGAGMTAACACQSVTGSQGEPLTFTRDGGAMCVKGNEWTNIQNGDLVWCGNGAPRIMPGGDGTGANGLMLENDSFNYAKWSEAFEDPVWVALTVGDAGVPVVVPQAATAPDGTLTADDITFPATDGGGTTVLTQAAVCSSAVSSGRCNASIYLKGYPTDGGNNVGPIDVCIRTDDSTGARCEHCTISESYWTRCYVYDTVTASASVGGTMAFGNGSAFAGGAPRAEQRVYAWGAQGERGSPTGASLAVRHPTTYIPTGDAGAVRGMELPVYFTLDASVADTGWVSVASTFNSHAGWMRNDAGTTVVKGGVYASNVVPIANGAGKSYINCRYGAGGPEVSTSGNSCLATRPDGGGATSGSLAGIGSPPTDHRAGCYIEGDGGIFTFSQSGTTQTVGSGADTAPLNVIYVGFGASTSTAEGVVKHLCVDPDRNKCR